MGIISKRLELEQENERLKEEIKDLNFYIDNYRQVWEVDKYKTCLQEIKEIATALYMNEWLQQNETARQSIQLLQEVLNKAEV